MILVYAYDQKFLYDPKNKYVQYQNTHKIF